MKLAIVTLLSFSALVASGPIGDPGVKRATDCAALSCASDEMCVHELVYCKKDPCPRQAVCAAKDSHICRYKPCENGGVCFPDTTLGYTCSCLPGYVGVTCEAHV
ncbi:adhesive plaque matrix protein 2-like [Haliotis rufescens]|uniref:adhesive plaque matrix protein 2-like n=1 Tax=Haliotis rufescens TaxID=6454 RepID=UPI00201F963A|nr:adhesive plaque matrix protein 2-like [Haliotis rufescens]